jgi:hypothetical protein
MGVFLQEDNKGHAVGTTRYDHVLLLPEATGTGTGRSQLYVKKNTRCINKSVTNSSAKGRVPSGRSPHHTSAPPSPLQSGALPRTRPRSSTTTTTPTTRASACATMGFRIRSSRVAKRTKRALNRHRLLLRSSLGGLVHQLANWWPITDKS